MSWEWSHTQDAYDHARSFLAEKIAFADLVEIAAEWDVHARCEADEDAPAFDHALFAARTAEYQGYSQDDLAALVWEKMEGLRTCTNGGHALWGCPYGCECHLIPVGDDD